MRAEVIDDCETDSSLNECEVLALGYKYDCGDLVCYNFFNKIYMYAYIGDVDRGILKKVWLK